MEMKHLNSLLGIVLIGSASLANASVTEVNAGTINFNGKVVSPPCVVAQSDNSKNVTLNDVAKNQFYGSGASIASVGQVGSQPAEFTIHLEQCDTSQAQDVTFKFNGETDTSNSEVLKNIAASDAATGVGVALFENDGTTPVKINESTTTPLIIPVGAATGEQTFKADYIATESTVSIGDVLATATFDVTFN
ncbi:fimbrial protein [Citrobacter braakii]|uniref:fimbrial protein n=1 Tax=Citrobacter braakii TaxID=57706 RepID=UPI002B2EF38C|nr:fimbrial protein [Citrobacter braakii]